MSTGISRPERDWMESRALSMVAALLKVVITADQVELMVFFSGVMGVI
jgi:hypothetical protein